MVYGTEICLEMPTCSRIEGVHRILQTVRKNVSL